MTDMIYCDKCGALMIQKPCEGTFGINATRLICPKCRYQYEIGFRYNPFLREYVKYYKFI
jgi:DNA-directed RNA polymerase subunit M/transcription elongation factor TFIIS